MKQILSAGTMVKFMNCPLVLVNDTEVEAGTDLRVWQELMLDSSTPQTGPDTGPDKDTP